MDPIDAMLEDLDDARKRLYSAIRARKSAAEALRGVNGQTADPDTRRRLKAERREPLREAERELRAAAVNARDVARAGKARVSGLMHADLAGAEWSRAAAMKAFCDDQAADARSLDDLAAMTAAAQASDDVAMQFAVAHAVGRRVTNDPPAAATRQGSATLGGLRGQLADLSSSFMKDTGSDAIAFCDDLARKATDVIADVDAAKAKRGEGPTFSEPGQRLTPFPGEGVDQDDDDGVLPED
ncbi:MAG: hypothetical protein QM589_12395 [Thermomicrobiales bacterium]